MPKAPRMLEEFETEPAEEEEPPAEEPEEPEEEAVVLEEKEVSVTEETAAEPEPSAPAAEETPERHSPVPNTEVYNVMQVLVEESAEKYMAMFHVCTCPRCKADVRALALSNLQPKYVVMEEGEYLPRMITYERQFYTTVTAQVMRACTAVLEHPRHDDGAIE